MANFNNAVSALLVCCHMVVVPKLLGSIYAGYALSFCMATLRSSTKNSKGRFNVPDLPINT